MRRTAIVGAVLCGLVCACERKHEPQRDTGLMSAKRAEPESATAAATPPAQPEHAAIGAARAAPAEASRKDTPSVAKSPTSKSAQKLLGGESKGFGGLGLQGIGSGGGGSHGVGISSSRGSGGASHAMGIGSIGTTGRGAGSGSHGSAASVQGYAYGSGSGSLSGKSGRSVSMQSVVARGPAAPVGGEGDAVSANGFRDHGVNPFTVASEDRLSTFAADVDTASYAIARRQLLAGTLPPAESVRVEEFLNYFGYTYEPPPSDRPLAVHLDAAPSPFTPGRTLLRVGVQAKRLVQSERKPLHLTFLVDVSGSMQSPDRLPLAKRALRILVDSLRDGDTVALCTYAGAVKDVLPPTGMEKKAQIYSAIEELTAGGSTAMASGLDLAYRNAMKTLDGKSVSRVLVLTDGDANVGLTSHEEMLKQIQKYVKEGVTLTTVGFGMGNLKDDLLEQLANKGNGNYYYVDSLMQARRVFHEQLGSTMEVVAQDVKIQVEMDPSKVKRYRLVGYENRAVADQDFRNDRVDAGEVGSGHTVTALYELELQPGADPEGLATVRVRAKKPRGERAEEWAFPFRAASYSPSFEAAHWELRFASAVMGAAEKLRRSPHAQGWDFDQLLRVARAAAPSHCAERQEFVSLLEKARPVLGAVAARR